MPQITTVTFTSVRLRLLFACKTGKKSYDSFLSLSRYSERNSAQRRFSLACERFSSARINKSLLGVRAPRNICVFPLTSFAASPSLSHPSLCLPFWLHVIYNFFYFHFSNVFFSLFIYRSENDFFSCSGVARMIIA